MKINIVIGLLSIILAIFYWVNTSIAKDDWHIKCFATEGYTMDVKAIAADGVKYDVKAAQSTTPDLLDIKAIPPKGDRKLSVKVLPSKESKTYSDVKAITKTNQILSVKAFTSAGKILDVKAFYNFKTGQYDIKCLGSGGKRLGIKAISPEGQVYDVKGIKDLPGQEELAIKINAHVKGKPQQ